MTDTELDEIDALADAATPGPWRAVRFEGLGIRGPSSCVFDADDSPSPQDAALIARSREAVPELVAEVRRLRREIEAIRDARNLAQDMAKQLLDTLACGRF